MTNCQILFIDRTTYHNTANSYITGLALIKQNQHSHQAPLTPEGLVAVFTGGLVTRFPLPFIALSALFRVGFCCCSVAAHLIFVAVGL